MTLEETVHQRIKDIVSTCDLTTISVKKIRKRIEADLGLDLKQLRQYMNWEKWINDEYSAAIEKAGGLGRLGEVSSVAAAVISSTGATPPKASTASPLHSKPKTTVDAQRPASKETKSITTKTSSSVEHPVKKEKSSRVNAVVKKKEKPKKSMEMTDHELALKLAADEAGLRPKRSTPSSLGQKKKKRRVSDDDAPPKKRKSGANGFTKPMLLSSQLSNFLKTDMMPRTQVVKSIWAYVKERDLQDPSDRRYIMTDGPLQEIFKKDRVGMFEMNKILAKHVRPVENVTTTPKELYKQE